MQVFHNLGTALEGVSPAILGLLVLAGFLIAHMGYRCSRVRGGWGLCRIANGLHGEVARDPAAEFPFVRFKLGEIGCLFCRWSYMARTVEVSIVEARVDAPGFFEATSANGTRPATSYPRARDIPRVHPSFSCRATHPEWITPVMSGRLWAVLNNLRDWTRKPVRVVVSPSRVSIEVDAILDARGAIVLARQLESIIPLFPAETETGGMVVLGTEFNRNRGRCPVCAEALDSRAVLCRSCSTPHHAECWNYAGCCAIFGCRGRHAA